MLNKISRYFFVRAKKLNTVILNDINMSLLDFSHWTYISNITLEINRKFISNASEINIGIFSIFTSFMSQLNRCTLNIVNLKRVFWNSRLRKSEAFHRLKNTSMFTFSPSFQIVCILGRVPICKMYERHVSRIPSSEDSFPGVNYSN